MERAHLNLACAAEHLLVELRQLLRQHRLRLVRNLNAALTQRLQQRGAIGHGKIGQPLVQALAHFTGRAAGEGDGQNFLRRHTFEQRAHDARDQHPGLASTGAGFHRHTALRVAGDGVKGFGADVLAVAFVGGNHETVQKSLRHKPRASQKSQALPAPSAGRGAPAAMRVTSLAMPSSNWSRRSTTSCCS